MSITASELQAKVSAQGVDTTSTGLKKVGDDVENLGRKLKGASGDMKESQGAWSRFKSDFTSGFNFSAGLEAFNLLKNGLSDLGSMAMTAATEYESSMNLLQASTQANGDQMEALGAKARALGADLDLPATSAGGAASAMLELSRAGLSIDESMQAAKGTIQLAATEMMKESEAAKITAGALNAFHLKGSEATRVADLLAAGSNASAASVRDLANGVQQAGFAFSANNQSVDDLVTSVAALTNVGLTGADSGTALKNALMRLAAPTAEASSLMSRLGFDAFDAQGKMKPMEQIIADLSAATAGMTDEERNAALNTIFLSDGMKAMIPLLGLGADGFDELRDKVQHQGAAAELAEAQTKGFKGAMEGFKSALETVAVEGLTPILPLLTGAVRAFSQLVGIIADNFVPILAGVGSALAAYGLSVASATVGTGLLGISLQLTAMKALEAAASMAAAALPFVAIGAAIGTTILVMNSYTDAATEQTAKILDQSEAFQDAKKSLEEYRAAQENTAQSLRGIGDAEAAELERLTQVYEEKLKRASGDGVGNWLSAAFDSDEVTQKQIAELQQLEAEMNRLKGKVQEKTKVTEDNTAAAKRNDDAMRLSREGLVNYGNTSADAAAKMTKAFTATQEEIEAAEKSLKKLAEEGPKAFGAMVDGSASFLMERESAQATHEAKMKELRKAGNDDAITKEIEAYNAQEQTAAQSYVNQQAALRQHLGVQLIEWVNAQAAMNPQIAAKSGELVQMLAGQYGVVADASQIAWGSNLMAIQGYVDGAIPTLDALSGKLKENEKAAVDNSVAAQKLNAKYTTEIEQKWAANGYGSGPEAVAAYKSDLEAVPGRVYTEMQAEAANAQAQAQKTQDQYERVERRLETDIVADNKQAVGAAAATTTAVNNIPASHTTVLNVDATSARSEAYSAGADFASGMAAGITANMYMVSNASQKTAASAAAAAKNYLQIQSPSRLMIEMFKFVPEGAAIGIESAGHKPVDAMTRVSAGMVDSQRKAQPAMAEQGQKQVEAVAQAIRANTALATAAAHIMGQNIQRATGAGIEQSQSVPRDKLKKSVGDIAAAYRDFTHKQEELNRDHAAKLSEIWDEYYSSLKEQTEKFNGDKFDSQATFQERIADMDAADREAALQRQQTAWDTAQQMAQEGRAEEAQAYYDAALAEIEADQARADKITGIAQDIADKKKALAEAGSEEERAAIAAEIQELESRKAYLEQLDQQQDQRAAEKLDALKNSNSAIAEERDKALDQEYSAYHQAQQKLGEDFGRAVDDIINHEDRMLSAHVDFANALIDSYQGAADAANRAMRSLPVGGGDEGGDDGEAPAVDGSHAGGLAYVPWDNYIARLHKGEEIKTAEEAEADRQAKQRQRMARVATMASATTAAPVTSSPATNSGPLSEGDTHIHFEGDVHIHNDTDIDELAHRMAKKWRTAKGGK